MRYQAGDVLDGYVLETECGSGAYGSVFLAENRTLGQKCALKILYKNGQQYEKELEGLKTYQQKCRHANLMRVDHVGENDECIFYTMDAADNLHPGQTYVADTLGNRLRERTRLSPEELLPMLRDLLDGLDTLHNAGILHRDIKPDNILWVNGRAMLGDIGLISNKTEASMAGTPGFISPRVWTRRAFTPQDDLYALAMVMYCALNGTQPEDYPIPGSMPLTDSVQQINRVYNEVLKKDSAVRTVKDFQALLQNSDFSRSRFGLLKIRNVLSKEFWKWLLPGCAIALLCVCLSLLLPRGKWNQDLTTQKQTETTPIAVEGEPQIGSAQKSQSAPKQEAPPVKAADKKKHDAAELPRDSSVKSDPDQVMKTPESASIPEKSAVSGMSDAQKISKLTETLEQEWRDHCRERLKNAGRAVVSPINLNQGQSNLSYSERKRIAQNKAFSREAMVRENIEIEEKYQLPNLKSYAELAIRYFGDVAYNDELVKKNKDLLRDSNNPEYWLSYYEKEFYNQIAFGRTMSLVGESAEFHKRLNALPPDERRMRLRSILFSALRRIFFNGEFLMTQNGFPVRSFPSLDDIERRLSDLNQRIDRF